MQPCRLQVSSSMEGRTRRSFIVHFVSGQKSTVALPPLSVSCWLPSCFQLSPQWEMQDLCTFRWGQNGVSRLGLWLFVTFLLSIWLVFLSRKLKGSITNATIFPEDVVKTLVFFLSEFSHIKLVFKSSLLLPSDALQLWTSRQQQM